MHDVTLDLLESFNCPHCGAAFSPPLPEAFSTLTCPACSKESLLPGKYGQFLLYASQGESITSVVFDAFDPKLGRNVTLKILNYVLSKNPELVEAFKHEALAAASLNSTYVLKVYEFGIHNRQPFMVMEHIEGKFLNEVLQQEQLTEYKILEILDGIIQGLQDMHQQGIMHGDVMPRNILIHTDGTPRISDFGLARFNAQSGEETPSKQWESWSSPYFMPPERITGSKEDHRGDFYSLGTTLFNMLTGELPFFDLDESKVLEEKTTMDPPDPRNVKPSISDAMAELTGLMMQRDPEDRPRDYEDLRELIHDLKIHTPKPERTIPQPEAPPNYHQKSVSKKKEPIAWFIFVVLLAILITMIISIPHREKDPDEAIPTPDPTSVAQVLPPIQETTPTPLPTAAPTALPSPTPPPTPTATPFPTDPTQVPGIEVVLVPPLASEGPVAEWKNQRTGTVIFSQPDPDKQPQPDQLENGIPVLRFSDSQMFSSLFSQKSEACTLITVLKFDPDVDFSKSIFIMGVDPISEAKEKISITTEPNLPYSFRFETNKGSALLTLPLQERTNPIILAFRRSRTEEHAYLGFYSAELSNSPSENVETNPHRFPGFQIGALEGGPTPFKGWVSEIMVFSRTLEDKEISTIANILREKYGNTP